MLYTVRQAAHALGVNPATLRRWETRGKIAPLRTAPNSRGHRARIFTPEDIALYRILMRKKRKE